MPEGVEIKLMTSSLRKLILNSDLRRIKILSGKYLKQPLIKSPGIKSHCGEIAEVNNKGKLSWWKVDNKNIYMTFALGLTGFWSRLPTKWSRIQFIFDKTTVYLNDIRNFAVIKILSCEEFKRKLASIGPDMFSKKFTLEYFKANLSKNIASDLLSQKVVSGPGTYIISEALYFAKVSPKRDASSLTAAEIKRIYHNIIKIAEKSYAANSFISVDLDNDIRYVNRFEFSIYGKKTDSHGNKVKKFNVNGRNISWVPFVQK
jgi:formamidopyrimidine-DNA glycosylase